MAVWAAAPSRDGCFKQWPGKPCRESEILAWTRGDGRAHEGQQLEKSVLAEGRATKAEA